MTHTSSQTHLLPRSTPEGQGVPSAGILGFIDAAEAQGLELHSLMFLRHGQVMAEGWWTPYHRDGIQLLYSLSKSFTSTAVGLAVAEGRLSLDDSIVTFFPEDVPAEAGDHLLAMRVRHLLSMATGHELDTLAPAIQASPNDWVRGYLSLPPEQAPGSIFAYNNGATHLLAAIMARVTGGHLLDYLRPRLLEPLGITDAYWQTNSAGIAYGFSGLHLATESIARLGQLYLQNGEWDGRQLLSPEWVAEARRIHVSNEGEDNPDWQQGYGFQFWRSRHDSYRGDGAYGQFCLILPEEDAVLVTTAATDDMQGLIDLVWAHVLPALQQSAGDVDGDLQQALQHRLATAQMPPVVGSEQPQPGLNFSGVVCTPAVSQDTEAHYPAFDGVSLEPADHGWLLTLRQSTDEEQVPIAFGAWAEGAARPIAGEHEMIFSSGGWTSPATFTAELIAIHTPHRLRISCDFGKDQPTFEMAWNVNPLSSAPNGDDD